MNSTSSKSSLYLSTTLESELNKKPFLPFVEEIMDQSKWIKSGVGLKSKDGIINESTDRLIMRWVQSHLKRGSLNQKPYTRSFQNFREDMRDGKSIQVLLERLSSGSTSIIDDSEIDPIVRVNTLLDIAATRIDYPVKNFVTSTHILGYDDVMNLGFMARLMDTNMGLERRLFKEELAKANNGLSADKIKMDMDHIKKTLNSISTQGN